MGTRLLRAVSSVTLARALGVRHVGADIAITHVAPLTTVTPGGLAFANEGTALSSPPDAAVIIRTMAPPDATHFTWLESSRPRLAFVRALHFLQAEAGFAWSEVPAQVDSSAVVGAHCVLEPGVQIGPKTVVGHHVVLRRNVRIGAHCVIQSGTVIGDDGFGFERDDHAIPLRMLQLGGVHIGDHVEIGSLSTVCRGTLSDTVIEDHVKIDDHVHVSHNMRIERGTIIAAGAMLCGGVHIRPCAWIAPNASVLQKVTVGTHATVGMGAAVFADVGDGTTVVGNPARDFGASRRG